MARIKIESRPVDATMTKCVSRNYFDKWCEQKTDEFLESGYWVSFCADCIGHTRAAMFENAGERYVVEKYGNNIQATRPEGYCTTYFRLR